MGGGFLLSLDAGLYGLYGLYGRFAAMLAKSGAGTEWDVLDGPVRPAAGVRVPDLRSVTACPFEYRWPDMVTGLAVMAAAVSEGSVWVLDGDGVIWSAEAVDPVKVRL